MITISRQKKKKKKTENPFRSGSWGFFTFQVLEEMSKEGKAVTVSEIYAALHQKLRVSKYTKLFADPQKLRKKTYFALWETSNKKHIEIETIKRDKETAYRLKTS